MTKDERKLLLEMLAGIGKHVDKLKGELFVRRLPSEHQSTTSAGPCDAIDAAVTQQQQTVDAAADALLLEQLTLMILQMQQMMCHSQNA